MNLITSCKKIIDAYHAGKLGQTRMPEDAHPNFHKDESELRVAYFTLPMALNYQRDSYALWEAALKTYSDPGTRFVFDIHAVSKCDERAVRAALSKYKLALQPNKHIATWMRISQTVSGEFGSWKGLFERAENDVITLKQVITKDYKKGFPYLSGPKIFNYWTFIIGTYGKISLLHREYIEIAPDTHITQCSVKLGVITPEEVTTMTKDELSQRWRELLAGSGIDPIDMHSPLWFWSRNGFLFEIE